MKSSKININFNIWYPAFIEQIFVWFLLRWRRRRYGSTFRRIKLTQDKYAVVDTEDFEKLNKYNWFIKEGGAETFYAVRKKGGAIVYMHRQILPVPKGLYVDHINRDGLDNRKANLRPATHSENCRNRGKMRGNYSSRYKGVHWDKDKQKWRANVRVDKKLTHLGYFTDETEAAKIYDATAKVYHGKYAALNFADAEEGNIYKERDDEPPVPMGWLTLIKLGAKYRRRPPALKLRRINAGDG